MCGMCCFPDQSCPTSVDNQVIFVTNPEHPWLLRLPPDQSSSIGLEAALELNCVLPGGSPTVGLGWDLETKEFYAPSQTSYVLPYMSDMTEHTLFREGCKIPWPHGHVIILMSARGPSDKGCMAIWTFSFA